MPFLPLRADADAYFISPLIAYAIDDYFALFSLFFRYIAITLILRHYRHYLR
jgi:hypothetical protein